MWTSPDLECGLAIDNRGLHFPQSSLGVSLCRGWEGEKVAVTVAFLPYEAPPQVCLPFYLAQSICERPRWVVQVQATVSSDFDERPVDTLNLVNPFAHFAFP